MVIFMIINELNPQGYCGGVKRALKIVKDALLDNSVLKPIYILGYIIHNKKVNEALNHFGVKTFDQTSTRLEMIDKVNNGTVIITAHGTNNKVIDKLISKNINFIDATCPAIKTMHEQIINHLNTHEVLFIGKPFNHPEVEGVLGINKEITLIPTADDAKNYKKTTNKPLFVATQTTLSLFEIKSIIDILKASYEIKFNSNVCLATTNRQKAILNQPPADLMIVVGDKLSSNSNKLKEVSIRDTKINSILIETVEDLKPSLLKNIKVINITSGASTPKKVTEEVINYLKQFDYSNKKTWDNSSKLTYFDILN